MALGRFAPPLDVRSVGYHLAGLLGLVGACLALPALVGVVAGEVAHAATFAGLGAAAVAVGWLVRRAEAPTLSLREGLVVVALAYPLLALVGAVAYLPEAGPADAFFEALSGFTTTGLTVVTPEALPASVAFFRSFSQWLGGAGIAIVYLAVLAGPRSAASRLYMAEFEEGDVLGNVARSTRMLAAVYLGLTAAAYAALAIAGAGAFDGLLHALSLVSTGGFSPFSDSVGGYDAPGVAAVVPVFMVLGATSLPLLHLVVVQRRWRRGVGDVQLRTLAVLLAAGVAVHLAFQAWPPERFGSTVFHVVSAATTTGFVLDEPAGWSAGAKLATVGLMAVGGAAGSTAGGLKLLRLAVLVRLVRWTVVRALLPREAHVPLQVHDVAVREDDLRRTVAVAVCAVLLLFATSLALVGTGAAVGDAAFEATSAFATAGPSVGLTGSELATWAKLVLCLNMWLGRVEILPVLLLLRPR